MKQKKKISDNDIRSSGTTPELIREENKNTSKKKGSLRIIGIVIADILLTGIGLVIFSLFHHVLPRAEADPIQLPMATPQAVVEAAEPQATPSAAPDVTQDVEPAPAQPEIDYGMWGEKFKDKFTSGEVYTTDYSYQSEDINIMIDKVEADGTVYFVADIYVRNIHNLMTAFADGQFGKGHSDKALNIAVENNAILAVSGDYCSIRNEGIVIRNGVLYRDRVWEDILIMNNDGSFETFSPEEFDMEALIQNGAYQGWSFGPMLLTDGQPMEKFNSRVNPANPRCAVGYYEPGHYCFVLVDGRQSGYSKGMTLEELSQLFYDLGCTVAYNMDGGQSAMMTFMGEVVNQPVKGGRDISDIIFITESQGDQ